MLCALVYISVWFRTCEEAFSLLIEATRTTASCPVAIQRHFLQEEFNVEISAAPSIVSIKTRYLTFDSLASRAPVRSRAETALLAYGPFVDKNFKFFTQYHHGGLFFFYKSCALGHSTTWSRSFLPFSRIVSWSFRSKNNSTSFTSPLTLGVT